MENTLKLYKKILFKLRTTRSLIYLIDFIWGILLSIVVYFITVVFVSVLEHFGNFPSEIRLFYYFLIWISLLVPFGVFSLSPLLKTLGLRHRIKLDKLALRIGRYYPDIKDKLSNSVQLMMSLSSSIGVSQSLSLASSEKIFEISHKRNFNVVLNNKKLLIILLYLLGSIGLYYGSFTYFEKELGPALYRIKQWDKSFIPPAPFILKINPIFKKVLKNNDVTIRIKAQGTPPESITLYVKESTSEEFDGFELRLDTNSTYVFTMTNLKTDLEYYAEAEWLNTIVLSDKGKIIVYEKPYIKSMSGEVKFPTYTNLEPRIISEQNGDITALMGSNAHFTILANTEIEEAKLIFFEKNINDTLQKPDTSFIPLKVSGKKAWGTYTIKKSGTYSFLIKDKNREINEQPVNYGIIALEDEMPSIRLLQPTNDVKLNENAILPISVAISDDYGFSDLKLFYRLSYSKYSKPEEKFSQLVIPIIYNGLNIELPYIWNLKELDIVPEDRYEFYLEVSDNDYVSGPKKASTDIIQIVLPSIDEVLQESEETQQNIQQQMEKTLKEVNDLQKDIEKFQRDLKQENERNQLTWEEQKKAQDLMKRQQDIQSKMENLEKQLSKNTEQLQQNNLLSEETVQKFMELQKLMKEVDSPELQKLQQSIQDAARKMSKEDMEKALKSFKFNEEQFKQSIERTLKVLKRLQLEQKVDALNRRAEKMQDLQQELENQAKRPETKNKEAKSNIQKKQQQLKKEVKDVEKELSEVEKMMEQLGDEEMPLAELKDAQRALNSEQLQSEMQQATEDLENGEMNNSSQNMQKAKNNLSNFKQKMQKLKDEMSKRSSEESIRQMEKAISDLLQLSKNQEKLLNKTQKADYNSTLLPNLARDQVNQFEGLMRLGERMAELSEKSFAITPEMGSEIANALQEMSNAVENFTDRKVQQITEAQSQALGSMNNAIGQMQQMLNAMQQSNGSCPNPGGSGQSGSGSGSSGMGQRLQQLAAQQQAINQMMQQMMSGGSGGAMGGGMSQEQKASHQRVMNNQEQAQKTMQQLQEEAKKYSNTPDGKKLQNELEKIQKEMQETMDDVKQNGIRQDNIKKQERILAKLLDLYDSQNEKEFEKRRESREGRNFNQTSPDEIDFSKQEGKKALREQILRQSAKQYSIDYQNLINNYFENLNNSTNKEN